MLDLYSKLVSFALSFENIELNFDRLIDGEWTDRTVSDPVTDMIRMLQDKKDRNLTQQWAVWLIKRDPEWGIKVSSSLS